MTVISEQEFRERLESHLRPYEISNMFKSVSGPGRSGAIAAAYASHFLKVPFIPHGRAVPDKLRPHLVIDTATESRSTLRKSMRKAMTEYGIALFIEPPRVRFWYERIN